MDDQMNMLAGRMTHRLTLDSEEEDRRAEEERREQEEYQRLKEEKRKRKEEKRKQREEEEREAQEKARQAAEKKKQEIQKYNDPAKLFESDSSSGDRFPRIHMKINEMYPKFAKKRRHESSSEEEDSEEGESEEESSESESVEPRLKSRTKGIEKKADRKRNREEEEISRKNKARAVVKVEQEVTAKDRLVQEVAVRWWYALPEWPPEDFNFEEELRKKGYRLIRGPEFKFADEVANGLVKVQELDGYPGVFKSKHGIVDVRPKETAPTINFFYQKSEAELKALLKVALSNQLAEIKNEEFKQSGDHALIISLERKLISLK